MKVVGLKVSLEGRASDLQEIERLAAALDKVGKNSQQVANLNKRIKELEQQIKDTGKATKDNELPGGRRDKDNVVTLASLRREMKALAAEGKSFEQLAQQAGELKAQQQLVNREIERQKQLFLANNESIGFYRRINAQLVVARENYRRLSQADREGDVGKELLRTIQRLDGEIKRADASMGLYFRNVGNYGSAIKNLVAPLRQVAFEFISIIGLAGGFQELVEQNRILSDSISDVEKTTGLAQEQVRQLSDEFRKIDTRTTLEDLLAIAEGAGRLGLGSDVEQLEQFTIALDRVNVALGDVLEGDPDQIATDLAKITSTFNIDEQFGVAGSIERTGAAINLLGSRTKANENFILDATKRLQGLAATAGISVQDVLGLTATLDELALRSESSTSAISKFVVEIAKSPERFAALAETVGITNEEFQNLLTNNPNEAILTVLEASGSTEQGLAALNDTLSVLGITGVREIQTITALSQQVDRLRTNQALANEEFAKTQEEFEAQNSLYDEFNTKNENLAASFDKLRNTIVNLVTQSQVQDFLQSVIESITRLVLNLVSLPKFLKENRVQIGLLVVALISFNAQAIAAQLNTLRYAVSQVTLSNALKAARIAQVALNTAFRANPIGFVVGVVALLVAGFIQLYNSSETVRNGVQALWGWVQTLFRAMVDLYENNLLVRLAFFSIVEPVRFLIGLFRDFEGTIADFKDRMSLTATLVGEFIERIKLSFQALGLAIKRSLTIGGEARQAITDQLREIEQQVAASQERVAQERLEYAKRSEQREVDRLKRIAEAQKKAADEEVVRRKETEEKKTDAKEDAADKDEELTQQEIERRKRLREQLAAERQRQLEEELRDRIAAAEKIADLEAELISNRFDRQAAQARISTDREIAGLVGDPVQIERQTELLKQKLREQLAEINEARAEAQDEALALVRGFRDDLIELQVQAGVSEAEASLEAIQGLYDLDESRIENNLTAARLELERQFAQNLISISEYQEQSEQLELDAQQKQLDLLRNRAAQEPATRARINEERVQQLRANLQKQFEAIDEEREARREELESRLEDGDITEDEFATGLEDSEALAQEQQLAREREFLQRRQQLTQEFAEQGLEFEEEIADRSLSIAEKKNEDLIQLEERRRRITLGFAEELSERVTSLVTGQIEDFQEFSKQLLLLTLDVIEKTLLLYAAQATGREIATKGFAGIATGAILAGIIKATFSGVRGLVERFEEGGNIGGAPTFQGSAVPDGGGMVNTGNLHAQGGIKGDFQGSPIEIERGEFVMRNGPVTHIVNRVSAKRYSDLLSRTQSAYSPNRFNSNRARIATAVNGLKLVDGGSLIDGTFTAPLVPPVNPRAITSAATSSTVNLAADSTANNAMLLELIQAVNRRIDRIEVVNDPSQTVRRGQTQIEVDNRNNQ